jgi:ER membrane protein complex subunit 4
MEPAETPQWVKNLQNPHKPDRPRSSNIPDPPGYTPPASKKSTKSQQAQQRKAPAPTSAETDTLKIKKAWELAIGPAKSLPMNAIGMYMTGSGLQIFSIMMVFMLFKTPVTAIFGINQTFERFESEGTRDKILLAKLAYVFTNCLLIALGLWKVNQMGLLP